MKNHIAIIVAAAFAAAMSLSCSKLEEDVVPGIEEQIPTGPRILELSFPDVTKTTLTTDPDSHVHTPLWSAGDKIQIIYVGKGEHAGESEYIEVPAEGNGQKTFSIEVKYWEDIVAVYPADAAISTKPYYKVNSIQDGSFAKANICVAETPATERKLVFKNATALFEITVPKGTKTLTVTSLGTIETNNGQRGSVRRDINTVGPKKDLITVSLAGPAPANTTLYLSVFVDSSNPVLLADLNFDNDGIAMGGFPPIKLRDAYNKGKSDDAKINDIGEIIKKFPVEASKYYTLSPGYFRPYKVIELVTAGWSGNIIEKQKWATMNVGATSETDPGLYFDWGDVEGHEKATASSFKNNYSFSWDNASYCSGVKNDIPGFSKYKIKASSAVGGLDYYKTLFITDDAAFVNWGGAWRMPDQNIYGNFTSFGINFVETEELKGAKFPKDKDVYIFLHAGGYGDEEEGEKLKEFDTKGYYWATNIYEGSTYGHQAKALSFSNSEVKTVDADRRLGYLIRPYGGMDE